MKTRKEVNGRLLVASSVALLLCLMVLAPAAEAALLAEKGDWGASHFSRRVFDNDRLVTCPWSLSGPGSKGSLHHGGGSALRWTGVAPWTWFPAFNALPVLPIWQMPLDRQQLLAYLEDHIPVLLFGFGRPFLFGLAFVPSSLFTPAAPPPAPTPIPGAAWLMASGLAGLALFSNKRRRPAAGV